MKISIIIPTLNEASQIHHTLEKIRELDPHEIIVADGGSTDETVELCGEADFTVAAPKGRGAQMNAGAKQATGSVLLFLHADCTLEPGALKQIPMALSKKNVVAGCFQMHVPEKGMFYRSINAAATLRVRLTGLVYGDQGLFLTKQAFDRAGGFPEFKLMEDIFICRHLRRMGKVVVVPHKIFVSPRRWKRVGLLRQTLRNWTLTALAGAGVHPDRLSQYYPAVR